MSLAALLGICSLAPVAGTSEPAFEGRVSALEPGPTAPGAAGELSLVFEESIEPGVLLRLSLHSEGVALAENRLSWRDVVDPQAALLRVRGAFVAPSEPGTYTVHGLISYVRCDGEWCRTKHAPVVWTIHVEAAETKR